MYLGAGVQKLTIGALAISSFLLAGGAVPSAAQNSKPNIVMLMTDDTGWNDFGAYSGGSVTLGHPTPNVDKMAKEGAVFTSWYGQASCIAGRASFMTGRIPIRSALSIVVAPGDENFLRKETPTIAEFFDVFLRHLPPVASKSSQTRKYVVNCQTNGNGSTARPS